MIIVISRHVSVSGGSSLLERLSFQDILKAWDAEIGRKMPKSHFYLVIYLVWPHQYELVQPMG